MQGLRRQQHLPAWETEECMQGLQGQRNLRAWTAEEPMQGLQGQRHLSAFKDTECMQGLQGRRHLRAWEAKEPMHGLQGAKISERGRRSHVTRHTSSVTLQQQQQHRAQDHAEAVTLFRLAAALGHAVSQFNLGVIFELGRGVVHDRAEAIRLYRLVAAQGHADAAAALKRLGARRYLSRPLLPPPPPCHSFLIRF